MLHYLDHAADGRGAAAREIPDAYADMMASGARRVATQVAQGIAPEQVAAVIVNAAERPHPRARYVVPSGPGW
jgi:hypothetical protein